MGTRRLIKAIVPWLTANSNTYIHTTSSSWQEPSHSSTRLKVLGLLCLTCLHSSLIKKDSEEWTRKRLDPPVTDTYNLKCFLTFLKLSLTVACTSTATMQSGVDSGLCAVQRYSRAERKLGRGGCTPHPTHSIATPGLPVWLHSVVNNNAWLGHSTRLWDSGSKVRHSKEQE